MQNRNDFNETYRSVRFDDILYCHSAINCSAGRWVAKCNNDLQPTKQQAHNSEQLDHILFSV